MSAVTFTGSVVAGNVDIVSGKPHIEFEINEKKDFLAHFDDIKGVDMLDIKIAPHRKKRSLDANAYAWVLIDKLSEATGVTKEDVYRRAVKGIGGNSDVVCVQSEYADKLRENWSRHGIGWISDVIPSKIAGCTNVILYYGSSCYDTAQMTRLIDSLIQDCEAVGGIQTKTPDEIANMVSLWEKTK